MSPSSISSQFSEPTAHTPLLSGETTVEEVAEISRTILKYGAATDMNLAKPLPKFQIFLLCYARLMEPIAFYSIFPYIAQMVERNGNLQPSEVGFYSGLIECLFSAAQSVVLMFWGFLADRYGRKPVLICSLFGMAIGPTLFGMTTSLWQMIFFRSFTGAFSSANLIIRTMIGEHCTPELQATAFSWYSFAGNMGLFLGPMLGAALVDPAQQHPSMFGGVEFLQTHPYALPGFVVSSIGATAIITSALFLEETHNWHQVNAGPGQSTIIRQKSKGLSIKQLLESPGIVAVLGVFGHIMLLGFSFAALLPIVLYTPIALGGLGLSTAQIAIYITANGAGEVVWLLFAFPALHGWVGTKGILQICAMAFPCLFSGYILINFLLRQGGEVERTLALALGAFLALAGPGIWMSFTGIQLAINQVTPNPQTLGTLNSVAEVCSSLIRSVVPALTTAIFAVGVQKQILLGNLAWATLILLGFALSITVSWFPDNKMLAGKGKDTPNDATGSDFC